MAFTEDLHIYKDTLLLCKILLKYSNSVSRTVRFTTYNEAVVKSCTALDLVRRINESWENREERMHDYILLMSEVKNQPPYGCRVLKQETGNQPWYDVRQGTIR